MYVPALMHILFLFATQSFVPNNNNNNNNNNGYVQVCLAALVSCYYPKDIVSVGTVNTSNGRCSCAFISSLICSLIVYL